MVAQPLRKILVKLKPSQSNPVLQSEIRITCLRLLARREHSQFELRVKLEKRGYQRAEIDPVVQDLAADGQQSDTRFTEQYFLNRVGKGFGPLRIKWELKKKGIVNPSLEELGQGIDGGWEAVIRRVLKKKFGSERPKDRQSLLNYSRYLSQRGFDTEQINRLIGSTDQWKNNIA